MSEANTPDGANQKPVLPLFYRTPEALHAERHAKLRLAAGPDFRFAGDTNSVPIMASEFAQAARFYPVVFAGEPAMPAVVLGLQQNNLFVDGKGVWEQDRSYIPAYVRRYPFTFIAQPGNGGFMLGLDMDCTRLLRDGKAYKTAQPLFEDGKPTTLTQEALRFCGALQNDHLVTRAFAAALVEQNLLIDQQAQGSLPDGKPILLGGFRIVDAQRFQELPDAVVVDWHKRGWLGLVHAHLASLACWTELLARAGKSVSIHAAANGRAPH
jgi:hypothetical protein